MSESTSQYNPQSRRARRRCSSLLFALTALAACGRHGRNVYGYPEDDRLVSRCTTGGGLTVALYINSAGGAAVGTSFSVTAERKPNVPELQIMYSEIPALLAIRCESQGFELDTTKGLMTFKDNEVDALRAAPRDLDRPIR